MNVYEIITERVIANLEKGTIPWKKAWQTNGMPVQNALTKKAYRGVNVFLLNTANYSSPYWLTYKQAESRGGNVKAGEKGNPIVFWKWNTYEKENDAGDIEEKSAPMLRYYTVFNSEQCEGLELLSLPMGDKKAYAFNAIPECERLISEIRDIPGISHGGARAFYSPSKDAIQMPSKADFEKAEEYYSTLFHEITHSTGHHSRLNRFEENAPIAMFGSESYSKEELVAEMGAAFLCGTARIEPTTLDNSSAYIASWLKALKGDKKLVIMAAAKAQKAADFLLNRKPEIYSKAA